MAHVKRKIVLTKETTYTKIQKRPRTKTCRKKNKNSTTTLLEELASETVSYSQVEAKFSQKENEEREKEKNEVDDDGERAEEAEEEEGNKKNEEDKGKQTRPNATGVSIMRSAMGKPFDTFRVTLKQNGLEDFFRNSYFGHFLDLSENNNARFQMTMVYELLKRRFIFQNPEKKDKVLINYCDMPLFFGRREFNIVSGLKRHPPFEPVPEFIVKKEPRRRKKREKEETRQSTEEQDLVSLVGTSFKNPDLIYLLNDIEAFNNYYWGHERFELNVKYLLKPLGPKTNNLFGFPWAFMAWAFEVIPHLTHQVNAEEEISSKILRWLRSKTKIAKNISDLYNHPHDVVVHPWLVPTKKELQMLYLITLGLVETLFDPVVDRVKMELAGARTIKRDRVGLMVVVLMLMLMLMLVLDKTKGQPLVEDALAFSTVNEFKNKRGVKVIPSKNVQHPYTPQAKRRKISFIKAIQNLKKKIFGELPMAVGEKVLEFKHVNVYKRVTITEKNKLVDLTRAKELRAQYVMHFFSGKDFRIMTSMDIWWEDCCVDEILSLMRERHVRYPEYYDSTDRILDLNFYSKFKLRYDKMSDEATIVGGRSFTRLINEFEWDENMINYVRVIRPYLGGMDWIGAKRLLVVMNINKTHFVTLEILLHEGRMNVYYCLLMGMKHAKFFTFIQHVFELLPKLLKQSGIMKHLPDKFLNEP
ncbi:hypothetical protein H5410_041902 [Solanum commersonii]|uniref:DUF1985 domain-containing protein n=1 Tax=Solanum commersonii TaxID=4109 RepID=A0A9J5XVY2_SOLCO|nr:hypothetical protein H5410_041902 [Solanum commersonii]